MKKITMYGAPICGDCVVMKEALMKSGKVDLDYRNITQSTANLREFLKYRDSEPLFDSIKEEGRIGIPFFVLPDGTKTLDITSLIDVSMEETVKPVNACSLDGKGNC